MGREVGDGVSGRDRGRATHNQIYYVRKESIFKKREEEEKREEKKKGVATKKYK